jgi:regulator of protease activity HflC (stomatin/prohibitin superfamily)
MVFTGLQVLTECQHFAVKAGVRFHNAGRHRREADGYRLKRINEAEGDAARFNALLAEYIKAPEVTRRRIYIETMQGVMPGIRSKIIVDEQTRSILPLLNLDKQKEGASHE